MRIVATRLAAAARVHAKTNRQSAVAFQQAVLFRFASTEASPKTVAVAEQIKAAPVSAGTGVPVHAPTVSTSSSLTALGDAVDALSGYVISHPAPVVAGFISALAGVKTLVYYMQGHHAHAEASKLLAEAKRIYLAPQDAENIPVLHRVAQRGDVVQLKEVLDNLRAIAKLSKSSISDIVNTPYKGKTPLCLAASAGKKEAVQLLMHSGASITTVDMNGETALFRAVIHGHYAVVQLLLDRDRATYNTSLKLVSMVNNMGYTPLLVAIFSRQLGIARLILRYDAPLKPNHDGLDPYQAAMRSGIREFRAFAKEGLLPRLPDDYKKPFKVCLAHGETNEAGRGPLYYATLSGDLTKVESCLEAGESMLAQGKFGGIYPLALAAQACNPEMLTLFHTYFCEADQERIQHLKGLSPVHLVLRGVPGKQRITSLKLLIEVFGFDPDIPSNSGARPLHRAAEQGDIEVVQVLLDTQKVNINAQDCRGNTPLHCAARTNQSHVVKLLLQQGALPQYKHHEFRTAEEVALILGHVETVDVFEKWAKWTATEQYAMSFWGNALAHEIAEPTCTDTGPKNTL